jgi:DNA invertase Pin-like site-specific DNA recombinase
MENFDDDSKWLSPPRFTQCLHAIESKEVWQMKTAAIYARVSTNKQSCDNQLVDLRQIANRNGWVVVSEFVDQGISGAKSDRPGLDALLKDATRRKFDVVMCWDISRLGRSLPHLVSVMEEMRALSVDLFFHQQAIDTTSPAGKLCFQIFGSLAEWERELIRERIRVGLHRARAQGVRLGRPSKMNDSVRSAIVLLRENGMAIKQIAGQLEIGVGTVYKALEAHA